MKKLGTAFKQLDEPARRALSAALEGAAESQNVTLMGVALRRIATGLSPDEVCALAVACIDKSVDAAFLAADRKLLLRTTGGPAKPRRANEGGAAAGSTVARGGGGLSASLVVAASATGKLDDATLMGIGRGFAEGTTSNGERIQFASNRLPYGAFFSPSEVTLSGEKYLAHVSKSGRASFDLPSKSTAEAFAVVLEQSGKFTGEFGIKSFAKGVLA